MRILKPMSLTLLHAPFERRGRTHLIVVVGAMLSLDGTLIEAEHNLWKMLTDTPGFLGSLDEIRPKVTGEALLVGYAYPPPNAAAPVVAAKMAIGSIKKEVWVVGDRVWKNGVPTEPEPFDRMPLTYERAFGGEGHAPNPTGKGFAPIKRESGPETHPLPNIEAAGKLVSSPRERPAPAGLGPIDPSWPQRLKKLGTYDQKWLETRYPDFADDFDPTYFNMAPEDQRIEGYFEGDEPFTLENVHPEKARLEGRLPRLSARCFPTRRGATEEAPSEVQMRCDTVWFVPHLERMVMIFRGSIEVADEDASDIDDLLVALDWKDRPREIEHFREVRKNRNDRDKGMVHALRDADLIPEGIKIAKSTAVSDLDELVAMEGLAQRNARNRAQRELDNVRENLRQAGLDPDAYVAKEIPPPAEAPGLDELPKFVDTVEKQAADAIRDSEERRKGMLAEIRSVCEKNGIDYDAHVEQARREAAGPPKFKAKDEIARIRGLAEIAKGAKVPVPNIEAKLGDPELERKLEAVESTLKDTYRRAVHHMPPAYALPAAEAARLRGEVESALAAGESLAGRDLTGADLAGLDFGGRNLEGAFFEKANLKGCSFRGANAERAVFARANLDGASFDDARLHGANFGEASLVGARLTGTLGLDLGETVFARANLEGADFTGACLDQAELSEARFSRTCFAKVRAKGLTIMKSDLRGVDLREAQILDCNLLEVDISGVDASGASMVGTVLLDVIADGAIFRGANLENLRVVRVEKGCSFEKASFREANMRSANLRGVKLVGSDLRDADLRGADFSGADLTGADLENARALEIRLMKTNLTDANVARADLMYALMGGAVVRGANFKEANVFRADSAKMKGDDRTSFKGANVKQVRIVPDRESRG